MQMPDPVASCRTRKSWNWTKACELPKLRAVLEASGSILLARSLSEIRPGRIFLALLTLHLPRHSSRASQYLLYFDEHIQIPLEDIEDRSLRNERVMRPIPMNIVKVIQSAENLLDLIKVPHIARSVPEIVTMTPPQSSPICYIHTFVNLSSCL